MTSGPRAGVSPSRRRGVPCPQQSPCTHRCPLPSAFTDRAVEPTEEFLMDWSRGLGGSGALPRASPRNIWDTRQAEISPD